MAVALTLEERDAICARLMENDIRYAEALDSRQLDFLEKKRPIRNYQEFKSVAELKRTLIGLHAHVKKEVHVTGGIAIEHRPVSVLTDFISESLGEGKAGAGKALDTERPVFPLALCAPKG